LEHESAAQMMSAVRALVPATNPITVNVSSNSLVVTDTAMNINRIAKLIGALDGPRLGFNENYKAQNIPISDLAYLVNRVTNEETGLTKIKKSEHFSVFFVPVPRTNSMLIRGYEKTRVEFALKMAKLFDVPSTNPSNVHVVYLKNAEAVPLANTLKNLFESKKIVEKTNILSGSMTQKNLTSPTKTFSQPELVTSIKKNPEESINSLNSIIFNGAVIQAEPNINAILVVAAEPVFNQIKEVIDMLDIRRAQVYIESLIVEISAEKAAEFGVQFQFLDGLSASSKQFFGGTNFSTGGGNLLSLLANPANATSGLNVGVINGTINVPGVGEVANLGVLVRALESEGNANIIATPTLLTLDNEEAKITIGQNVPFVTGQFTSTATGNNPFQTVERRDVGTSLTIKPLITQGGTVKLKIFQEVSRVLDSELSTTFGTVSTTKRSIESTVLVEDEQFVVLGGLIQDQDSIGESKVPILGDIPIMGNLFKYENKIRRKTNLFVFLRPVVIRSEADAKILTMDRYKYLKGFENRVEKESPFLPNFDKPIIPSIINNDNLNN
jgi:general secretion pathway protein D